MLRKKPKNPKTKTEIICKSLVQLGTVALKTYAHIHRDCLIFILLLTYLR